MKKNQECWSNKLNLLQPDSVNMMEEKKQTLPSRILFAT